MATKTIKVTLYSLVETEAELPTKCPKCGADFFKPGSLHEWNWTDTRVDSHLAHGKHPHTGKRYTYVEGEGGNEGGDAFMPCAYWCAECDEEILTT